MRPKLSSTQVFQFDWSRDPRELKVDFKQTKFDSLFYELITKDVITTLSPQLVSEPHNLIYDDESLYKNLIGPLERFICNLDEDAHQEEVDKVIQHVRTLKQPSKLCRKVLKAGDVLFSCNDCGFDSTCVVCIDCFHKSAHKDHNYRMSNTDGGGCCDCGDVEAWKQHPACSDHMALDKPNVSLSHFETKELRTKQIQLDQEGILEKISLLPEGMASRFFMVCQACLNYAHLMLSWANFHAVPSFLDVESYEMDTRDFDHLLSKERSSRNYFTVLFNDEVHTYDHVINTLVKIIKCNKMTASVMASTVSREGRSLIYNDDYDECKQVRDAIAHIRDSSQGPLKVEVIHGTVLAHQAYALKLIEWVQRMSLLCDAFRVLTAFTLFGTYEPSPERISTCGRTLLMNVMLSNTSYWKIARVDWNDLFVATLLTEYSIKESFARTITRMYPRLMQDFIEDDHDHSVSILTMTTQLYTVPSLICMLIEEENALTVICRTFIEICRNTRRETSSYLESRHPFDLNGLKRGFYLISDLRHLINLEPTVWTDKLRSNVIEAVKLFLGLLNTMQGMDSVKRQLGQHIEFEPEWETGMTLQSRLISFISRLVTYCSYDEQVLVETLNETQKRLLKNVSYKTVSRELFNHQVSCIQYDVSTSPVSVHLPLTRFAASLIIELMRRRTCDKVPYDESLVILNEPDSDTTYSMIDIMEPSLRTEVMIAQFRSGMWRRNGYSLVNQILYFSGAIMRKEMFDRDILVLQEAAAMCDANEFMMHLLNKFNLFTWVCSETTRDPLVGPKAVSFLNDDEILTQTMALGEEFLQLVLTIVSERYRVGIGKIEEEDVMKNEIIQLLCIGPFTRSDLTQKLYVNDHELDCIKKVANLRRSTESSTGKYELKEEFYERFNPFFYHYNRRNQSNALDAQLKRKRTLKEALICCPPPVPVELTDQFRNLNELLRCDITLTIVQKILRRALGPPDDAQECSTKSPIRFLASDLQLDQCLHLIGLGLHEQVRNPRNFDYLLPAYQKDIFHLLKECYEKANRSKDLIFWLMRKTHDLIDRLNIHPADLSDEQIRIYTTIKEHFIPILSICDNFKQENKKRNSELAAKRRERIMAMMKANQDKFLSNPGTKQLVAETESSSADTKQSSSKDKITATPSPQTSSSTYVTRSGRKVKQPRSNEQRSEDDETRMDVDPSGSEDFDHQMDDHSINDEDPNAVSSLEESSHLCILCRDEQKIGFDKPTMVLLAYIQRSAVLSKNRKGRRIPNYALTPTNQSKYLYLSEQTGTKTSGGSSAPSFTSDNSLNFDATFMPADLFFGPYISTCGHAMHYDCWRGFLDAVTKRENSRPNRGTRHVSFELDKNEILCPLCECISNATIPLLPDFTRFAKLRRRKSSSNLKSQGGTVFRSDVQLLDRSPDRLTACLHSLRGAVDMFKHVRHLKELGSSAPSNSYDGKYMRLLQPRPINDVLEELDEGDALLLRDFISTMRSERVSSATCTKSLLGSISALAERINMLALDLDKDMTDIEHSKIFMMMSWSIAYTIQAYERSLRFRGVPIFEDLESAKSLCLSSLLRFSCASTMTLQSDMLQSLLVKKLRFLLISDEYLGASPCCLDIDAFEMFVSTFILLQKLYSHSEDVGQLTSRDSSSDLLSSSFKSTSSSRSNNETQNYSWTTSAYDHEFFRSFLHLMLVLDLIKVIITLQNDSTSEAGETGTKLEEQSSQELYVLQNFYMDIVIASGHPNNEPPRMDGDFISKVKCRLLPFLRSCAIFFYHLSHVEPGETLRNKSAFFEGKEFSSNQQSSSSAETMRRRASYKSFDEFDIFRQQQHNQRRAFDSVDFDLTNEEFNCICHYLGLPNDFSVLLSSQEVKHLSRSWLRHSRVLLLIRSALKDKVEMNERSLLQPDGQERKCSSSDFSSASGSLSTSPVFSSSGRRLSGRSAPSSSTPIMVLAARSAAPSASSSSYSPPASAGFSRRHHNQQPEPTLSAITSANNELMPVKFIDQPHSVNCLIDMPYDYSELVDRVSDFTCPSIKNEDSRTPTLCLVCGMMLCSQSYCCQRDLNDLASNYQKVLRRQENIHIHQQLVGSCAYHAHECSGGVGLFLRIRNCQILLLSGRSKGCYMPAPYIDDHGETDFGLLRGNPLHLNRRHYERLQQMWMNHSIPEQISRTLEYSSYNSNISWHLH